MEARAESTAPSERWEGFGRSGVSEERLDVGRSWRTRKGAQKARGRQRAKPKRTSVSEGEVSKGRLRVFEAETEVQERDRSRHSQNARSGAHRPTPEGTRVDMFHLVPKARP
jgi:hypothetical protein